MEIKQNVNRTISNSNVLILPHKDFTDSDIMLACPYRFNDESQESHQEKVICYCRTEDEKLIKRVEVDLYTGAVSYTIIESSKSENPSSRRQAVSIAINPENASPFSLNVFQHKGHTYMNTS
jgi:hypothetical protein